MQTVQIRQPAVSNLMVDSLDRTPYDFAAGTYSTPSSDFTISKNQSILNGFFHRIATTEVVVDWAVPNIQSGAGFNNKNFTVQVGSGSPATVTLPDGFYTVEQVLDRLVTLLNVAALGATFSIVAGPPVALSATAPFTIIETTLSNQLELTPGVSATSQIILSPDLRLATYMDFISPSLTYNQELKDAATTVSDQNVLCRWYFAWDNPPTYDLYGFPILQGYSQFVERRLFNPAKQIRWESNMPIGQLQFQVTSGFNGALLNRQFGYIQGGGACLFNWLMTLQVSED